MLYLLYGENRDEARVKANVLLESLEKKKPDASVFKIEPEQWSEATFEEYISGQGLFEQKYIVFLKDVLENKEAKEYVLAHIKEVTASENIFIFLDGKLDKASATKFEKHASKVQVFEEKEGGRAAAARPKDFNIFSLTDAFGRRDKKSLWVLYQKSVLSGAEPEEVHGILFWQLKAIMVAMESRDAKQAGLAPFVFSKAQGFAKNFKSGELALISKKMVALYSDARRGLGDMDILLERFILSL